jgi:hypothetical protein
VVDAKAVAEFLQPLITWLYRRVTSVDFWLGLTVVAVPLFLWMRRHRSHSLSVALPFGLGSWSYDTTPADRIVAWKMHVQLVTRKAALPFDEDHDLICDVYDSLFSLFAETRHLLLELPPREFERASGVATLILRVQNHGIRPHLTRWQADFRRWWERAERAEANIERSPQLIQRDYPRYAELVADLRQTNTELAKYADELLKVARADGTRSWLKAPARWFARRGKVAPVAPTVSHPPTSPAVNMVPLPPADSREPTPSRLVERS